ncbi:hypothetical protein J6590_052159 [Homalodisca vitripennis]|nr:hypothetical protein J6590_052159 [Homalodisca vitripennis]
MLAESGVQAVTEIVCHEYSSSVEMTHPQSHLQQKKLNARVDRGDYVTHLIQNVGSLTERSRVQIPGRANNVILNSVVRAGIANARAKKREQKDKTTFPQRVRYGVVHKVVSISGQNPRDVPPPPHQPLNHGPRQSWRVFSVFTKCDILRLGQLTLACVAHVVSISLYPSSPLTKTSRPNPPDACHNKPGLGYDGHTFSLLGFEVN